MATPRDDETAGDAHTETCVAFPPSAPMPLLSRYQPGSILCGKYRLDALLGEGGMGAVWRATNLQLELPVAIKLIRADLDRDALRARLNLEARSVAKLGHPAIVRVYDVGESELADPFIVMELLHGETLAQALTRGRLSAIRAVQLILPIIDACAVAHARGVVHRDLKPDNIFIAQEDQRTQPKILDFGIAKLTDPRDENHRLTEVGTVVGSPDYMSPEQARGREDVDYRTDIWSSCVVLYEAITGAPPFSASNYNALLYAIVEDEPKSLSEKVAGDGELWTILKKGLSKDRSERQRSMAELGRSLAGWLLSHGAHEDAAGIALDSKWLGRSSDPLSLGGALPETMRPPSVSAASNLTHDSQVNLVDSRAPFTATIRPNTSSRTYAVRAAFAAVALLTAGALTVLLSTKQHFGANSAVRAAALTPIVQPASTSAPETATTPETTPALGNATASAEHTAPASKPNVALPVKRWAPTNTAKKTTSLQAPQIPPPRSTATVAKPARELDLLSPY